MKEYLIRFFREFEYDSNDAAFLLGVYDAIAKNTAAYALLQAALAAYEANIRLDYKEEIQKGVKKYQPLPIFTLTS